MDERRRLRITVRIEAVDDRGRSTLLAGKSESTRGEIILSLDGFKAKPTGESLKLLLGEVGDEAIDAAIGSLCDTIATAAESAPQRARVG